jgi:hypothetical protein
MEKYILIYIYNYYICLKIDFFHFVLLFGFQMTCHNEPCFAVGRRFKYESSCEPVIYVVLRLKTRGSHDDSYLKRRPAAKQGSL